MTRVALHVYDLLDDVPLARAASILGVGVHHSAVEILGREYAFGFHDDPLVTGVFDVEPRCAPPPARYRMSIDLGVTPLRAEEVEAALEEMRRAWPGTSYDVLTRNCNAFSEALVVRLGTERRVPGWVNRLAMIGCVAKEFAPCLLPMGLVGEVRTLSAEAEASSDEDGEDDEARLLAVPAEAMRR